MSGIQKRAFRLPWGSERPDGALGDADAAGELGDGPLRRLDEEITDTTAGQPARAENDGEDAMTEAQTADSTSTDGAATEARAAAASWPQGDNTAVAAATAATRPAIRVEARPTRRDNALVAGLVRAMREAALANREEMTARLRTDAAARGDAIREAAAAEALELQKRAEDDITGIREWSKAEIARVRQETEDRIERRREALGRETEDHESSIARRVAAVEAAVAAYEAEMEAFFTELLAEDDPARLAALAERAPEPPDLDAGELEPEVAAVAGATPEEHTASADAEATALDPMVAAVAEAEAMDELATVREPAPEATATDTTTRVVVRGLTSVAGISAFKGAIGRIAGVRTVSVTSGERGAFVFTVRHAEGLGLNDAIRGLGAFGATVSGNGAELDVMAREPAA